MQDITNDEGDGLNFVQDTDDGDLEGSGEDGEYSFASETVECAYVDDDNRANSGVFAATITSTGEYNNFVCGSGWAVDDDVNSVDGSAETATVDLDSPHAESHEDIVDADYRSTLPVVRARSTSDTPRNDQGETGTGSGVVRIEPTEGNGATTDATAFSVTGTFTVIVD